MAAPTANPSSLAQPAFCRHSPEVGAVCGKAARTVLCGGRSAMSVPTATAAYPGMGSRIRTRSAGLHPGYRTYRTVFQGCRTVFQGNHHDLCGILLACSLA